MKEKGIPEEKLPPRMQYSRYNAFVASVGAQLIGWTEIDVEGNPIMDLDKLKTVSQWQRLLDALESGVCRWVCLSDTELAAKRAEVRKEEGSRAVTRPVSSKGKKKRGGKQRGRKVTSRATVSDNDDESDSDASGENGN